MLLGRRAECEALDEFLNAVRAGQSRALVIRGEAGVGKSALLEYMIGRGWIASAIWTRPRRTC
jgi:predicted ATPase